MRNCNCSHQESIAAPRSWAMRRVAWPTQAVGGTAAHHLPPHRCSSRRLEPTFLQITARPIGHDGRATNTSLQRSRITTMAANVGASEDPVGRRLHHRMSTGRRLRLDRTTDRVRRADMAPVVTTRTKVPRRARRLPLIAMAVRQAAVPRAVRHPADAMRRPQAEAPMDRAECPALNAIGWRRSWHEHIALQRRREVLGSEYVDANLRDSDEFMMAFQRAVTEVAWGIPYCGTPAGRQAFLAAHRALSAEGALG